MENRDAIFAYIFKKADESEYMRMDSAESSLFQSQLESDKELINIAGKELTRKYIKDTVLNQYSKKQRYIKEDDVKLAFIEKEEIDISGSQRELENGVFTVKYGEHTFLSTSSSINEWNTVFKRFGKIPKGDSVFAFLTCGGVEKEKNEIENIKSILNSYGIHSFIVKPNEAPVSIKLYIKKIKKPSKNKHVAKTTIINKGMILLAGISGTGKTRFIREQAANQKGQDTYCLVPVRPDWHEPSDLLGYVSRLSGKKEYVTTPVIDFIVKSWIHIFEQTGEVRVDGKIGLTQAHLEQIPPFWLCLDEMNLAPVEQYFADYLSIIETRHWLTATDVAAYNEVTDSEYDHIYECAPLLKANVLNQQLDDAARQLLATQWQLDLNNSLHAKIWEHFCRYGIALPFNLMVAGTVNMDETTHGFSRKVIDRALTFDFNEFFPNNFDHYFAPQLQPNILGYPLWSDGRAIVDDPALNEDKQSSVDFLKAVNTVLEKSPFELAYRALNELMLALLAHRPTDKAHLIAIWDDFMMCKVLPRIEGDSDKLRSHRADLGANAPDNLLCELEEVLQKHFGASWDGLRPDLFNSRLGDSVTEATPAPAPHLVPCRSKKKLAWMKERLEKQCFTSYWP
ncbi:hypothetical protein ATO46_02635 [Aeromonas schubertii]|uniref:McrB family protein n=1 Tax=Aeromonas schubertii TaxID=652 RepID=UPI00067E6A28|nr:hypothetical protein [Aeromonas schubertii]KUE81845.1 hypothetical protein ATO46_02635 [Aeromonas schubertii]